MKYPTRLLLLVLTFPLVCGASEDPVYESLSGVTIGRVFVSQTQRDELDARRNAASPEGTAVNAVPDDATDAPAAAESAGYIIVNKGPVKVWKDGDFVDSNGSPAMSFPGDVKITRHSSVEESAEAAKAVHRDDESANEGA